LGIVPVQDGGNVKRKPAGFITGSLGLAIGVTSAIVALRPVTNIWGQECGSVLIRQELEPISELTRALEQAALETACPDALSPLVNWSIGLALMALALIGLGVYLAVVKPEALLWPKSVKPQTINLGAELDRLKYLHNSGAITDAEFAYATKKLLSD
jgi:hypothetical protein